MIQQLESYALPVGPVASCLHVRLWARWRSEGVGVQVTPDGTRGGLVANLGSCCPSEVDGVGSQAQSW